MKKMQKRYLQKMIRIHQQVKENYTKRLKTFFGLFGIIIYLESISQITSAKPSIPVFVNPCFLVQNKNHDNCLDESSLPSKNISMPELEVKLI